MHNKRYEGGPNLMTRSVFQQLYLNLNEVYWKRLLNFGQDSAPQNQLRIYALDPICLILHVHLFIALYAISSNLYLHI